MGKRKAKVVRAVNKQPFYVSATFLFTTTRGPSRQEMEELCSALRHAIDIRMPLVSKVELDSYEAEPGDPADLL